MHALRLLFAGILVSLFMGCNSQEADLVGSWKRTQYLDSHDEPTVANRKGLILDFNKDKSFGEKYVRVNGMFGSDGPRENKGTWALTDPIETGDVANVIMRYGEGGSVLEQRFRVRELTPKTLRLIGTDGANETAVFERR